MTRFIESKHRLRSVLDTAAFKTNAVFEFFNYSGFQRRDRELSADARYRYRALLQYDGANHCFFYPLNDADQGEISFLFQLNAVDDFLRVVMGRKRASGDDPYHVFSPLLSFGNMCASTIANAVNNRRGGHLLVDAPHYKQMGSEAALQRGGLRKFIYVCRFVDDRNKLEFVLLIKIKRGLLNVLL